jgi:hypothetical protein
MTALAFAAALAAMLVNSLASLLEASGSRRTGPGRPQWRQPRYLGGLACDGLGWVLSVVSLRVLPVFAVQAVLAGTVPVTEVAGAGGSPRRLPGRQVAAVALVVTGLGLVAASAAPGRAPRLPPAATPVLLTTALLVALAAVMLRSRSPLLLAVLAGVAFGGVSLSVRAVHIASSLWSSVRDLLTEPVAYAVLVFGATGTVVLAGAMRRAAVGSLVAVLSVTEVVVPGLVGLVLLGDRVRPGWGAALAAGWALAVGGLVLLTRSPAQASAEPS